jgi:pyruvate dehydrogenase complex dehydrogenase (E1) component
MFATVPNCRAYDPAFAYELAVILEHGHAAHAGAAATTSSSMSR